MEARLENVNIFFKYPNIQFFIPLFQREYQWTKENTQTLLTDLFDVLTQKSKKHFIGTILFKNFNKNNTTEKELIDGQQRVTTLFLLFVALKRIAKESNDLITYQQITKSFLENEYVDEGFKMRFKPSSNQKTIFDLIINDKLSFSKEEARVQKSSLYQNYKLIYFQLKEWMENEERSFSANEILQMLFNIEIVAIELNEKDELDVQKIFESINSTGLELSNLDLIRNFLMMDLDSEMQENIYLDKWLPCEKKLLDLEKRKIVKADKFLLAYLQFRCKKYIKINEIYQEYKKYAKKKNFSSFELLDDIEQALNIYQKIYDIDLEKNPNKITYLNFFKFDAQNNTLYASFLMTIFNLFEKNKISSNELEAAMKLISNYVLRRKMLNLDTSAITKFFPATLLGKLKNKKDNESLIDFLNNELYLATRNTAMFVPTNEMIIKHFESFNAYSIRPTTKIMLWIIETWDKYDSLILNDMTIEHIMPQNPPNNDDFWFKSAEVENFDDYQKISQLFGNLTLMSKGLNSLSSNKNWSSKKELLESQSRILMNRGLVNLEKFKKETVSQRQDKMLNKIFSIFNQTIN